MIRPVPVQIQIPFAVALDDTAVAFQMLEEMNKKERVSAPLPQGSGCAAQIIPCPVAGDELAHGVLRQWSQVDFIGLKMHAQLVAHAHEGRPGFEQLGWPVGADHEQPGAFWPAGQPRHELHRCLIAPVQIFEQQHQRLDCGKRFDSVRQLAGHVTGARVSQGPDAEESDLRPQ